MTNVIHCMNKKNRKKKKRIYDSVYICERMMIDRKMLHHIKKRTLSILIDDIFYVIFDKNLYWIKKLTPSAPVLSRVVDDDDDEGGLSLTIFVLGYWVVDIFICLRLFSIFYF